MDVILDWTYLGTVAGAGLAVTLLVQLIKAIAGVEINKWGLRLLTYAAGVVILDVALAFIGWNWQQFALNFINGALVFFTATGEYHAVVKELFTKETTK